MPRTVNWSYFVFLLSVWAWQLEEVTNFFDKYFPLSCLGITFRSTLM